jgi:hypothetical protein
MHEEAKAQNKEIKAQARREAREITSEAHVVANDVLADGTEVSRNLRELSVSLRNNAERLLRDVRLTHGGMTARLDQVGPGGERGEGLPVRGHGRGEQRGDGPGDDLDVPEFIPRS